MPPRRPYNPNTAYGGRKRREEAQRYYDQLPEEEKQKADNFKIGCLIAIIIVALLIGLITGTWKGILKWLSH